MPVIPQQKYRPFQPRRKQGILQTKFPWKRREHIFNDDWRKQPLINDEGDLQPIE
jgi:hypothetical protein